jgi:hypothetical protein
MKASLARAPQHWLRPFAAIESSITPWESFILPRCRPEKSPNGHWDTIDRVRTHVPTSLPVGLPRAVFAAAASLIPGQPESFDAGGPGIVYNRRAHTC